jgi:hypothetical protein
MRELRYFCWWSGSFGCCSIVVSFSFLVLGRIVSRELKVAGGGGVFFREAKVGPG